MIIKRMTLTDPANTKIRGTAGMTLIVLGMACFVISLAFDGGFVRGLFIGATVALMVMGAYVVGASRKQGRGGADAPHDTGHWLPSGGNSSDRLDG